MTVAMWKAPHVVEWSRWLLDSHRHWTNQDLIERTGEAENDARALFKTPFVIVSHGVEDDPILNYGNQTALDLWETTWGQFVRTPSRLTAEPDNRAERKRMLEAAKSKGFFDGYRGVRISSTGRRFLVENALIWTVLNSEGQRVGQAAFFSQWRRL